ncbi:MAG: circularly permuted type 2 ATP-grasp protein, partial [Burkholderiales bacterium]
MRAADGSVRAHFRALADWLAETPARRVAEKRREADLLFHRVGITFAVYGDEAGAERLIPFDTIPRILPKAEWEELAAGLKQRVDALNRFLHDIYHGQEILKAGVIPSEQVLKNPGFQKEMRGIELPNRVYSHVAGIDLVRHSDGRYYVLEDNLRTPSGVSYMIENRKMMMRLFPELFERQTVLPVEH